MELIDEARLDVFNLELNENFLQFLPLVVFGSLTPFIVWYEFKIFQVPIVPSHVHSINESASAEKAAYEYEFVIRQLVRTRIISASDISDCPKFDLILLEMGSDGHIASLFPNHSSLKEKNEWVTYLTNSPKPPPERITFTLPVINSASNVAVVVTGSDKSEAVRAAVDDGASDFTFVMPARMIQLAKGKLVWFLDKAAAA